MTTRKPKRPVARLKTKPRMIYFGATWCAPCKHAKPIFKEIAEEAKPWCKVEVYDIDKHEEIADRYRISAVPFVLFLDAEGKRSGAMEGISSAARFRNGLRHQLQRLRK